MRFNPLQQQGTIRNLSPQTRVALGFASLAVGVALTLRRFRRTRPYSFKGRTVLITGASRGLGFEIARQLADEGARLWLVARTKDALEDAAAQLRAKGATVETIVADVGRAEDVRRIVADVVLDGYGVDVLVNNAGTIEVSPFEHATLQDFEDSMATHFWGPLGLIRDLLPHLQRAGDGRIVNISSIGGRIAVPHLSAYAAGKFALTGLSETLHAELQKSGVAVTTVTPGLMRTGSYVNARVRGNHPEEFRWFAAMSATPVTSMAARRAAAQIITACREKRATLTTGWQARVAHMAAAVAPNTFAAVNAAADRVLLPRPTADPRANEARLGAEVDPGPIRTLLSEDTRRDLHQPEPTWG